MNKVSEYLLWAGNPRVRLYGDRAGEYAEVIERLVQAAEAIHDHNGECPCVYADAKWNELNAALEAFRETAKEAT